MTKLGRFAAACVAVLCAFGAFAVEQVSPGSGDDAAAITAAIAAAAGEGGDGVVQLAPGTYTPTSVIEVKDGVTIRGAGRDKTFISGASLSLSVFKIVNAQARLESLTVCNCNLSSAVGYDTGEGRRDQHDRRNTLGSCRVQQLYCHW